MAGVNEIFAPYIHGHSMFQLYDAPWVTLDWTLAQHNHQNAAGGGQLTDAALSAAVGIAKGGTGRTSITDANTPLLSNGTSYSSGPVLQSGVWTPSSPASSNVTTEYTMIEAQWVRFGNLVFVSGQISAVQPTTVGAISEIQFTPPIDPASNFPGSGNANGVVGAPQATAVGQLSSLGGTKLLRIRWTAAGTNLRQMTYFGMYQLDG